MKVLSNWCGKSWHIKQVNLTEARANVAHETREFEQPKWKQCLFIEVIDQLINMTSFVHYTNAKTRTKTKNKKQKIAKVYTDYSNKWIFYSSCSHHITRNAFYYLMFMHIVWKEPLWQLIIKYTMSERWVFQCQERHFKC